MAVNASAVRVVIVEDDARAREWMERGVRDAPALSLAASFAALTPAIAWFAADDADVLLTDLGLPDGHALPLIGEVAARRRPDGSARTDVLVMSVFGDEETVIRCIEAGAVGYIHKDSSVHDLARTILEVRAGASPISPMIARRLLARFKRTDVDVKAAPAPADTATPEGVSIGLTSAEGDVLAMVARGYTYSEIARVRGVSINTVQTQIKALYAKLAVHSRGEAVFEAARLGLIKPPAPG
jgi:DNA-binding NarL/FixJ family response regulator